MNKIIDKMINLLNKSNLKLDETSIGSYDDLKMIDSVNIKNLMKLFDESMPIIKLMADNYISYQPSYLNEKEINEINTSNILRELNNFPSFKLKNESSIYSEIKNVNKRKKLELVLNKNTKIKIFFYYSSLDEQFVNNQIGRLSKILYVFCNSFGLKIMNTINNFNIRFLIVDFPRRLNNKFDFKELGDHGIFNNSSGYTNKYTKEMVLSRKSGLTGLLIHELIHLLDLDFHFWENEIGNVEKFDWKKDWVKNCNMVECTQQIKSNCGYYSFTEAICNTTSSYLLAIYSGIEYHDNIEQSRGNRISNNIQNQIKIKKIILLFYIIEYIHCYINCCKLLKFFGFDNYDSFFNNTSNRKYFQDAHVFEYIVLRTFIITYFYDIVFRRLNKFINGEKHNSLENYKYQKKVSDFIFKKMMIGDIKNFYDLVISKSFKNDSIEYFCTNFISK
tara:strand:- start:165 stop:1505 length:1341 start_codon:yes stop_codon:yes gene_type:complete